LKHINKHRAEIWKTHSLYLIALTEDEIGGERRGDEWRD